MVLERVTKPVRVLLAVLMLGAVACDTVVEPPPELDAPGLSAAAVGNNVDYKVVIVMIDGPRWTECAGDPTQSYADQMWSILGPQGTVCTNFRNVGTTKTLPGHTAVTTGVWENIANDGSQRPSNPTIFEYYRKATGAPLQDAALVGGKSKLDAVSYSDHPDYGNAYRAKVSVGYGDDYGTFNTFLATLQTDRPRLSLCSLSQVDQIAHTGNWSGYLNQIAIADSLVTLIWNTLQADTGYAGRTYMFVTADHGRHDDQNGGFQNHGDSCEGCQHIIFFALGPDIRAGHVLTDLYTQRDVCATAGAVLGVDTSHSDGTVMIDIFEPTPEDIARQHRFPDRRFERP
jgi:hypothetical protein